VIAALAVITVLAPAAAHAERWAGGDPFGDVEVWHFDPAPCGTDTQIDATQNANSDITRLLARHTRTAVQLTVRFRDLDPQVRQVRVVSFLAKEPNYPDPRGPPGRVRKPRFLSAGAPCRTRPEVDLDANVVRASVARSCLGNPRWVPCRCRRVRPDRLPGRDVRQLLR